MCQDMWAEQVLTVIYFIPVLWCLCNCLGCFLNRGLPSKVDLDRQIWSQTLWFCHGFQNIILCSIVCVAVALLLDWMYFKQGSPFNPKANPPTGLCWNVFQSRDFFCHQRALNTMETHGCFDLPATFRAHMFPFFIEWFYYKSWWVLVLIFILFQNKQKFKIHR